MLQCISGLVILSFKKLFDRSRNRRLDCKRMSEQFSNENVLVQLATSVCLNTLRQNVLVHSPEAHVQDTL